METTVFLGEERAEIVALYRQIIRLSKSHIELNEIQEFRQKISLLVTDGELEWRGSNHSLKTLLSTLVVMLDEMGLGRTAVLSLLLYRLVACNRITLAEVQKTYGTNIHNIVQGLVRVQELYDRQVSVETENFRKLLLSFAEDLRVVLIIIAERLCVMRTLNDYPTDAQQKIAQEVSYLYAPLAHRLGLYAIKTILEDLALKYTNREIYTTIAKKLNETKRSRDAYIAQFIKPLKEKLQAAGFDFELKGRTKSIHSIYNKIVKKKTPFEDIYDLFAIRVILNSPLEKEKSDCWQVYSIVADMYQPNPLRLRDWLSIPKSNGYESLHTTVMGPQGKWVEVQIRTRRMDEVAEKGLAAHWKYKGVSSEESLDNWLKGIREVLENPEMSAMDYMENFKLNLYDKEVFVFSPSGDLHKLPKGATVLDFAFNIHSKLGTQCIGAIVNKKNVSIRQVLNNGDQIEVLTSPTQTPKQDWLNIAVTSRAKTKIKQCIKELQGKNAEIGKEALKRRLKNWKIEFDEAKITRLTKKLGYKSVTDLYLDLASEKLDILAFREEYQNIDKPTQEDATPISRSASAYEHEQTNAPYEKDDVLVIDQNLKNVDFSLAKCCHPIYGDDVFGFVSAKGGIKIHRCDCPNAPLMISRFGYRIVKARWSGKAGSMYAVSLRVVGTDDIGIVTNITSVISKEQHATLRSITVDSADGLFSGIITILVSETSYLTTLIKKLKTIRGVKSVERVANY